MAPAVVSRFGEKVVSQARCSRRGQVVRPKLDSWDIVAAVAFRKARRRLRAIVWTRGSGGNCRADGASAGAGARSVLAGGRADPRRHHGVCVRRNGARVSGPFASRLFIPRLSRGVMNVQNFHRVRRDSVEYLVRISANRDDSDAGALGGNARALRPSAYSLDDRADSAFDYRSDGR